MCITAYFFFEGCKHSSELYFRPCSEPQECGLNGRENIVRIPWLGQSWCDACFAPDNNSTPRFDHVDLRPEDKKESKAIFHNLREHHANHGPESQFSLNPQNLDLFIKEEGVKAIEEAQRISRTLELQIKWDSQCLPPRFHTLEEKRLVLQLRRVAFKYAIDQLAVLQRYTTATANARFLALSPNDKTRVFRNSYLQKCKLLGTDDDGNQVYNAPCECLITRAIIDRHILRQEESNHYVYRWYSECPLCKAREIVLEVGRPVHKNIGAEVLVPLPWWLLVLKGIQKIPKWRGGEDGQGRPGFLRRTTTQFRQSASETIRSGSFKLRNLRSRKDPTGGGK